MALVPPNKVQGGYPLGLTGATAATRYVGATASGAPASGTFAVGDFIIDQSGSIYVCTVAGSPGTWTQVGGTPAARTLFSSTLGAGAASIDTGANGIAQTADTLVIWILSRTDVVAVASGILITLNNDDTAVYDFTRIRNLNATVTGATSLAQVSWALNSFGASALANAATVTKITIPGYRGTTFLKQGEFTQAQVEDTDADARYESGSLQYRSTAAISRMKVAGNGGNLVTGSRLLIVGMG